MRVVSCLNPQRVFNRYTKEFITVPCGKCRSCHNMKAKSWINRLDQEKRCWKYCYFVTLTYNNDNLPRLYSNDSFVLYDRQDSTRIPFEELTFKSSSDAKLFNSRLNHSLGIPYAKVTDIQKFHKRLNKYIHDNYTQKYQNFRYFLVSEYGKDTFRPHYHALYFFNERKVSDHFKEILFTCWSADGSSKGRIDAQIVLGSATSYVAQYINSVSDLPSFYSHRILKPFYVFSKSPVIGSLSSLESEDADLFFSCSPTRFVYDAKRNEFINVPLSDSIKNRLFPRLPKYSEISLSLRARLYGLVRQSDSETFSSWLCWLNDTFNNRYFSPKFLKSSDYGKEVFGYISWLTNNFKFCRSDYLSPESFQSVIDRLKRFYYMSRRVSAQSDVFGISIYNYTQYIDTFYNNVSSLKLSKFYESQENYTCAHHDVEDLGLMYDDLESYLINNNFEYVPQIEDTFAFKDLHDTSEKIYNDSTKTHKKNDYLDKCRDVHLSNILKNYFAYV